MVNDNVKAVLRTGFKAPAIPAVPEKNPEEAHARSDLKYALLTLWERYKPTVARNGFVADREALIGAMRRALTEYDDVYEAMIGALAAERIKASETEAVVADLSDQVAKLTAHLAASRAQAGALETEAACLALVFGPSFAPDDPASTDATVTHKNVSWVWRPEQPGTVPTAPARWTVDMTTVHATVKSLGTEPT